MRTSYIKIPTDIINNYQLSSSSKLLFGYLLSLSKKEGYCYASNDYLSNTFMVNVRTISKLLKELKEEKLIETKIIKGNRKIYIRDYFL